jgi:class 3 adenylate cyclase/pimeloyl-ACP methyl ester carboxylesterase
MTEGSQRRLAAIVLVDVVGYSRLIGVDEAGTLAVLREHRAELIDPLIARHGGRTVKTMGDGLLLEFPSIVDATNCAVEIQRGMRVRNEGIPEDQRIVLRIGVNLADVIIDGEDILGDGVNVAARLESLAVPGGICISRAVHDQTKGKVDAAFSAMGQHRLKNLLEPIDVWRLDVAKETQSRSPDPSQEIHFCKSADGTQIAYAISGKGAPLVRAAHWMSHLQYEWESPVWKHWIAALSKDNTLIRYDARGNGLSAWNTANLSFHAMVADLESVADASRLERFALLGVSQSCAVAVAYAVRHPDRVSHLLLYGGFAKGWRKRDDQSGSETHEAMATLIREKWGSDNPAFRQMFAEMFIPGASREQMAWFNELQKNSTSPLNASRLLLAFGDMDVSSILPLVSVPTLVFHARNDEVVPFDEGKALAAGIPGARFFDLNSSNHILLAEEPAFGEFTVAAKTFISLNEPV